MFKIEKPTAIDRIRFGITSLYSKIAKRVGYHQSQIVVCGYPRGGTSLLYNMLSATLQHKFTFTSFEKYYIHHIHKLGNIASKAPLDINHLEYIDQLNIHKKNITAIIVIRDIRDVVTSKHPIQSDEYFIGYDFSYWPQGNSLADWKYDAPGVLTITDKIRKLQNNPEIYVLRYEDLVKEPDAIQSDLKSRFGLPFKGLFSKYHEFKGELAYKYEGKYKANDESLVMEGKAVQNRAKRWHQEKYRERLVSQFEQCPALFDILIEFGYESDRKWFEQYKNNSKIDV